MTTAGQRVSGSLAGPSEQAVLAELESRQLTPVVIEAGAERKAGFGRGVSTRRLGESYGQMADLLRAGVPLLRSLKLLGGQKSRGHLALVYRNLAEAVEKGSDLGAAMEISEGVFPPVHIAMVRAGEKGGFLEQVLARLNVLVTRQADLKSRLIGNLIYPSVLVVFGVGVAGVIFGVFVPKFRGMFAKLGDDLPVVTKLVFAVSDAITAHGLATAVVLAGLIVAVWRMLQNAQVKAWISARIVRAAVLGPILRGFATARFCGLLGSMLANGVPVLTALGIAKDGAGNLLMVKAIEEASESVRSGEHLAPPLSRSGMFDEDVVEMIAVGESANNLDEVLIRIGDTIEARLDRQLTAAMRLVEPLLLLVLAGVVGVVAAGLLLPMSKLSSAL